MNSTRFLRVLVAQMLPIILTLALEQLELMPLPDAIKLPAIAAIGALINAMAKASRASAYNTGRTPPTSARLV